MNSEDSRNLILAIVLSVLVLIGWNYFYGPKLQQERLNAPTQAQTQSPGAAPAPANGASAPRVEPSTDASPKTRAEALALSPRVTIDTPALDGSIALQGGLIDDIKLKAYRETIDPKSPEITLFSPIAGPAAYWAQTGFVAEGSSVKAPTDTTVWTADSTVLTPRKPITLTWNNGADIEFKRVISVDDKYMFTIVDSLTTTGGQTATFRPFARIVRRGRPQSSGGYGVFEGLIGKIGNNSEISLGYTSSDLKPGHINHYEGEGGWLGFTDKYWASAIIPEQNANYTAEFYTTGPTDLLDYQTDFVAAARTLPPNATTSYTTRLFVGAKEVATLQAYERDLGVEKLNLLINWGWTWLIAPPLSSVLEFIYRFVGNFGVAILLMTVLVKLIFFPLANQSYRSMAKMKLIQPKIAALKDLYPDDRQKQQQAQMELFKKEGVNPVAGCLPMIVQIPVFLALYTVIVVNIDMRQAPFFGWIRDLSAPDPTNIFTLFGLIPWDPAALPFFGPVVGHFLMLGIWPIFMGVSMFFQMKMNPEPTDPVQKTMFAYMPLIFMLMLSSAPAGLVIYWTWNNTLTILQQSLIMKRAGVKIELFDNLRKLFQKAPPAVAPK